MKMDISSIILVIGGLLAALIIGISTYWSKSIDNDKADKAANTLLTANEILRESISSKNEEIVRRSDELTKLTKNNAVQQAERDEAIKKIQQKLIDETQGQAKFAQNAFTEQRENSQKIRILQDDQIRKTEEVADLSKQLKDLSSETLNNLTGKNSYCYLRIVMFRSKGAELFDEGLAQVYLIHSGKYTLRNVRVSLVSTDGEIADKAQGEEGDMEDIKKYHRTDNPYVETVPLLIPNQDVRLKDVNIRNRGEKFFNIFFSDSNNFWFQRILLRDPKFFDSPFSNDSRFYASITQVYKLDLDKNLNQVYRFEIIVREGASGSDRGHEPNRESFSKSEIEHFPTKDNDFIFKYGKWKQLHWNGNYLEKAPIGLPKYLLDPQ